MTVEEVESALTEAIREIQTLSGRSADGIGPDSMPIGSIPGFDSINGVEVGAMVTEKLGIEVGDNPLLDERGKTLTIRAAAVRISRARQGTDASPR
jgi:acyl carrier protein